MTTVRIRREPGVQLEGEGGDAESLQLLDTACLCSICHSFFDAPLILRGCGHSFCSACIRQSLDFQEKSGGPNCPTCRTPCDARDLVPNVALREVVHHYTACKQRLNAEFLDCENNKNKHRQTSGPTTRSRSRGKEDRTLDDDDEHGREKSKERRVHAGSSPSSLCIWDDEKDEEWGVEEDEEDPDELLSPVVKKPRRQKQTCREETSSHGFVDCPICKRSVPAFYINSHVDQCLVSTSENMVPKKVVKNSSTSLVTNEKERSGSLTVPPKLVPTLVSEKSLRMALRKYGLPSDGRKPELLERYNRMRLAVETANDKGEAVSYAKVAHRVMTQERQRAAASLLAQTDSMSGPLVKPAPVVEGTAADSSNYDERTYVVGPGASFKELIAVTKARDAARKKAKVAN